MPKLPWYWTPAWGLTALGWCGLYAVTDIKEALWVAIGALALMVWGAVQETSNGD